MLKVSNADVKILTKDSSTAVGSYDQETGGYSTKDDHHPRSQRGNSGQEGKGGGDHQEGTQQDPGRARVAN